MLETFRSLSLVIMCQADGPGPLHEEALNTLDHEADQVNLANVFRTIMAGAGLSGESLEAWLREWMQLVAADVSEIALGGIASTIPGSDAAKLLVESRLGKAIALIAGKCKMHWSTAHCASMAPVANPRGA